MKKILIIIVILILIALGVYFITKDTSETVDMTETITTEEPQVTEPTQEETDDTKTVIGTSVENRDITYKDLHLNFYALPRYDCTEFPFGNAYI